MPLTDLIRYFNSTDSAGDSSLYGEGEGAAAWHDGLHLRSLFQPIVNLQRQQVVGHQAFLAATRQDGSLLSAEAAYAACQSAESVVHFDRLCRTLHALNFLAQRRHAGGYLQLSVHPRHLLAVPSKHGLVFEAVLKRCGLAPDDIVLELASGRILDDQRLADAVHNYRQRGYRIALSGSDSHPELFAPDIIKQALDSRRDPASPARLHIEGIASDEDVDRARQQGAELGQGPLFGEARPLCVSTHNTNHKAR
jgi:EAL domain-containing protein (putative c-di-GMP-specific phosphodiesterase class I)